MFKEKLGICLYEENYYEEEIIKMQDEEPIEEISKASNKKWTKELIEESAMNQIKNQIMNQMKNQTMNQLKK